MNKKKNSDYRIPRSSRIPPVVLLVLQNPLYEALLALEEGNSPAFYIMIERERPQTRALGRRGEHQSLLEWGVEVSRTVSLPLDIESIKPLHCRGAVEGSILSNSWCFKCKLCKYLNLYQCLYSRKQHK